MNGKSFNLKKFSITHIFEILVVVMIVVLCLTCNGFAKVSNIMGIFRSMALVGVLAFGIMMVIICGQIDLSAAYTCAMSGIVIGLMNKKMPDSPMGIVLGIL